MQLQSSLFQLQSPLSLSESLQVPFCGILAMSDTLTSDLPDRKSPEYAQMVRIRFTSLIPNSTWGPHGPPEDVNELLLRASEYILDRKLLIADLEDYVAKLEGRVDRRDNRIERMKSEKERSKPEVEQAERRLEES